jgi:hypothetical protein
MADIKIAERAAREIYGISLESAHNRGPEFSEEVIASIVERAIAESHPDTVEYWKSRAETAELKVLTFHEEIAELGDGEPSPPPHKFTPTNGNIYLCRVCHQPGYDCTGEAHAVSCMDRS